MDRKSRYSGMTESGKAWLLYKLLQTEAKVLLVCAETWQAEQLSENCSLFSQDRPTLFLPALDTLPFENVSPQVDITAQRIFTVNQLQLLDSFLCIATVESLSQRIIDRAHLDLLQFKITTDDKIDRETLIYRLNAAGYQRVSLVEHIGQFSVRGYNIDVFPNGYTTPIRIELTVNNVTSIRSFDSESQRSLDTINAVRILPVREYIPLTDEYCENYTSTYELLIDRAEQLETPPREREKIIEALKTDSQIPGKELYHAIAHPQPTGLFDLLPTDTMVVINDEVAIQRQLDDLWGHISERYDRLSKAHYLIPKIENLYVTDNWIQVAKDKLNTTYFDQIDLYDPDKKKSQVYQTYTLKELTTALETQVGSGHALLPFKTHIKQWRDKNYNIAVTVGSEVRAEKLQKLLQNLELDVPIVETGFTSWLNQKYTHPIAIIMGSISAGVIIPDDKLVVVAEHELFKKRSYRQHKKKSIYTLKQLLQSLGQLAEQDLVVHDDYGIGRYHGLKNLTIEGVTGDFLHVEYADSTLYVPVQQIGKIQKYNGPEGTVPSLDKLSSNRWKKTKRKVKDSVVSLAGDLVKLYASRSVAEGWPFEPMGADDENFADDFPYNETVDQLSAITETLNDMAKPQPMDRLICGDVGFGKTEVAMRAAFKCTQHGKQVAVLVPTTILVEQHLENFKLRFTDVKLKIKAVSRFYSSKVNKQTVEELGSGMVDIVIGTHALLARNVSFADLGLVIIDEEHRFGVAQKEKLKQLKLNVDVLTLTATPIPRTLHMSLLGLRDVSLITTPPTDRKVIRTYVATRDDLLVKDTILREVKRSGQVFFVHNRVKTIATVTEVLQNLVPEARFAYAHGQMSEKQLEPIMKQFIDREIDVLVATSIIESGLDIPNANTLIVDRADTFGLAQLYQLRGRVGRGTRQAYAYFLIPNVKKLTGEAQQRLQALQSLDDLGQGFHLAVRDLEIRGAGNLLGKEQSGSVLAVGFDLYMKIVNEAVQHLKGEQTSIATSIDPEVKLSVAAFIPDFYIPDVSERLIMYQRLASIISSEEADKLAEELYDRCGPAPEETQLLIEVMRLRGLLRQYGVLRLEQRDDQLLLNLSKDAPLNLDKLLELTQEQPKKYSLGKNLLLRIHTNSDNNDVESHYRLLSETLDKLIS